MAACLPRTRQRGVSQSSGDELEMTPRLHNLSGHSVKPVAESRSSSLLHACSRSECRSEACLLSILPDLSAPASRPLEEVPTHTHLARHHANLPVSAFKTWCDRKPHPLFVVTELWLRESKELARTPKGTHPLSAPPSSSLITHSGRPCGERKTSCSQPSEWAWNTSSRSSEMAAQPTADFVGGS